MPSAVTAALTSASSRSGASGNTQRPPRHSVAAPNSSPPIAPSTVFFGLMAGASCRRPNARPV